MAFDAAATVQAPMQSAAASAKSAARRDDASDPFGALLAMLDGARTDAAPPPSPRPSVNVSADEGSQADSPAPTEPGKDASADEAQAVPEAASDPATLVAAMMTPAVVAPAPVAAAPTTGAPAAETPAAPPYPTTVAGAVVPALDPESSAVAVDAAAPETQTAPVTPAVQTAAAETAEVAPPVQKLAPTQPAEPAQTATPALAAAPVPAAAADPATPASAEAAPYRLTGNDKPADPIRAEASAIEFDIAAAPRAAQGEQGRQFEGDGTDGRPSDADTSQQARNDNPAVPAAELATFAADAAPDALAPAVGVAQAATPAPVIAAQAAVTPVRGAPETVAHLAAQMIQRLDGQTTRFDLTLNPQSLGRVDVRIEIGAKGALRARMAFDDAATAQEMNGRHTELRAALQSAGFDVPEGALSFDVASGGGGAFADRQDADRAAAPVFHNFADTADQDPAAPVGNKVSAPRTSGVDIRV
jgi:hypothetical protein